MDGPITLTIARVGVPRSPTLRVGRRAGSPMATRVATACQIVVTCARCSGRKDVIPCVRARKWWVFGTQPKPAARLAHHAMVLALGAVIAEAGLLEETPGGAIEEGGRDLLAAGVLRLDGVLVHRCWTLVMARGYRPRPGVHAASAAATRHHRAGSSSGDQRGDPSRVRARAGAFESGRDRSSSRSGRRGWWGPVSPSTAAIHARSDGHLSSTVPCSQDRRRRR